MKFYLLKVELFLHRKKDFSDMMTKEQHIKYWMDIAGEDWTRKELLFNASDYIYCLYLAHQTLKKLAKANWVCTHQENYPPRVHNIVYLLEQLGIDLGTDLMEFLGLFNDYQLSGRYPDYERRIYAMCTREFTIEKLETVNEIRSCLLKMLQ